MPLAVWILLGVLIFALISLIGMIAATWHIGKGVYESILVRQTPEKWGRECSAPDVPEHKKMFDEGVEWGEKHVGAMKEVSITSVDGLKLAGQYFDFGSKRCALIIPGRSESLLYSYYFAKPYHEAGCNILVIDVRAHGMSEGKYNTVGTMESHDIAEWCKAAVSYGNEEVIVHGICVGGASTVAAGARGELPKEVAAFVTEGLYTSFPESFKQHMITDKRPVFPVLYEVMFNLWRNTGANPWKETPGKVIDEFTIPTLFLHGREDKFSIPPTAEYLFAKCGAEKKKLVWFEKGSHSHLRINAPEKYDEAIKAFLKEI